MTNQSSQEAIFQKTLYVLIHRVGLTSEEVAKLRLSDLHLAGKTPNITFAPVNDDSPRVVDLDLEAHRVLVGWLVARPDSASDHLILGKGSTPMDPPDIEQAVEAFEQADLDLESKPVKIDDPKATSKPDKPSVDENLGRGAAGSATTVSPPRPTPSRPPPSAPEMGTPPPGFEDAQPFPALVRRPTTAPEEDETPDIAKSSSPSENDEKKARQTPLTNEEPVRLPTFIDRKKQASSPEPIRKKKSRVPPKPVRKKDIGPTPVIVQRKGPEGEGAALSGSPVAPRQPSTSETQLPKKASFPFSQKIKPVHMPDESLARQQTRRPVMISVMVGSVVAVVFLCVVCIGGSGLGLQSESGRGLLAGLGLIQAEPSVDLGGIIEETEDAITRATEAAIVRETSNSSVFESPVSPLNSPLATPTLPPTSTPTPLPPTNPPIPTETATPIPEEAQPAPTETPVPPPTNTPVPPNTSTPEPPPPAPAPSDTPTPAEPSTPALKYEAPVLLEPKINAEFISGNTVVLRWQSVGELAPDEQYAVRMIYPFHNQITYQGGQTKDTEWVVPLSLYGQIDPPANRYEWFVVVERLNSDGSGTAISPETERWGFVWR